MSDAPLDQGTRPPPPPSPVAPQEAVATPTAAMVRVADPTPVSVGAVAHVFVDDVQRPVVTSADYHHLARARRLRAGELVTVSDGAGTWRVCQVPDHWTMDSALDALGALFTQASLQPATTVAFAVTKSDKPETAIQHLTELGVDRIVVVIADRSIVRFDAAGAKRRLERWQAVAREAAMQSRRTWLPTVEGPIPFRQLVHDETWATRWAMADVGGGAASLDRPCIAVGPEGGWSPAERAMAPALVGLGPQLLRAETAALAVGTVMGALRSGLLQAPISPA